MPSCYECNCLDFSASGSSLDWSNQSTSTLLIPVLFCIYFPKFWTPWRRYFTGIGRVRTVSRNTSPHLAKDHTLTLSLLQGKAPAMTLPAFLIPSSPDKGHLAVYSSIFEIFLVKCHSTDCPGMKKNGMCLKPREEKYLKKDHLPFHSTWLFKKTS